jgi:hypothetical protein
MSFLPADKATNADVSFHYYSGFSSTPYYDFSVPSYLGNGVTRPTSNSFVLSSGRSYWLRGAVSLRYLTSNNYKTLYVENEWELQGSLEGFKSITLSCGISAQGLLLQKNPTNRVEAVLFVPSSVIATSVTVKLKQTHITSDTGDTTANYSANASYPCGCIIMSVPD